MTSDPNDERPRPKGSVRAYWRLAGDYWKGATALQAWGLTIAGFVLVDCSHLGC